MKNGSKERERFWQAHLSAWERSGLTQQEYCKQQGVKEWSLLSFLKAVAGKPNFHLLIEDDFGKLMPGKTNSFRT